MVPRNLLHFIVYRMLLFYCLAMFLDFAKLAAAEENNDPDSPGRQTILILFLFSYTCYQVSIYYYRD